MDEIIKKYYEIVTARRDEYMTISDYENIHSTTQEERDRAWEAYLQACELSNNYQKLIAA